MLPDGARRNRRPTAGPTLAGRRGPGMKTLAASTAAASPATAGLRRMWQRLDILLLALDSHPNDDLYPRLRALELEVAQLRRQLAASPALAQPPPATHAPATATHPHPPRVPSTPGDRR